MEPKKQVALIVLDGWGYREETKDNAIAAAKKPNFDRLWSAYPHSLLSASGQDLGLPPGQMGNSELGHMTIGAGRIIEQDLVRINKAIESGEFDRNPVFANLFEYVKKNDCVLQVAGLLSPGGIHSHMSHLFAFLRLAKESGVAKINVHVFTDGRDTPPQSAAGFIRELEDYLEKLGVGKIASVSGRLYAMDRDKRWERLELAEEAMWNGIPPLCDIRPSEYVRALYEKGAMDEHIEPFACADSEGIKKEDAFFLFNFRSDRMRMLAKRILDKGMRIVTMTDYGKEYKTEIAFPPLMVKETLGKVISEKGLTQVHIAETEKYAHATYFLNCGEEKPYPGETDILVPSPKGVLTYDLAPKMSAAGVADKAIEEIKEGTDFIFVNFANADMVGHTANVPAIVDAIEEIDRQIGRIIEAMGEGITCVTADHGNAEINMENGVRHTAHTTSLVPLVITKEGRLENGILADVAPTVLALFGIEKPDEMTGKILFS